MDVSDLKELVVALKQARDVYDDFKKKSTEAWADYKEIQFQILDKLKTAELESFKVPDVGNAFIKRKYSFKTPKALVDKRMLYSYISEKYGAEFLEDIRSINSQSLNSFCNKELKLAEDQGEILSIPGVEEPQLVEEISFRKG